MPHAALFFFLLSRDPLLCCTAVLSPRALPLVLCHPAGCVQVYHELKSVIKEKYGQDACNVGDEGGFAPNIQSNLEGIELLMAAIKKAGYENKVSPNYPSIGYDGIG